MLISNISYNTTSKFALSRKNVPPLLKDVLQMLNKYEDALLLEYVAN